MSITEKAVSWAKSIAADPTHGYSQINRWGPDYDCSSFVISAYKQAGVPLVSTYTGNMRNDFLAHGFVDVTDKVNLVNTHGFQAGDVLLNERSHTAMYIGNWQIVQASHDELGGVTGATKGDQTGTEIAVRSYYNFPWDCVLRYSETPVVEATQKPVSEIQNGTYTVQPGDSLWLIAERFLGNGYLYTEIMTYNGMTSSGIHPGQVIKIPGAKNASTNSGASHVTAKLPVVKFGDTGIIVRKVQGLLSAVGYQCNSDGDYGTKTKQAVSALQAAKGIPTTGNIDNAETWEALLQ